MTANRILIPAALGTLALLAVPLVAMGFTDEVAWGPGDFIVAGVLLFGTGVALLTVARRITTRGRRVAASAAVLLALALVWAELAVGLFD